MTKIGLLFYRFRTSNYWLPIEVGRWTNVERHNRLCQSCEIGDEFHYVLQCPNFVTERKIIIPKILFNRPSALKLSSLFNKKKPETIRKLWFFFRSKFFFWTTRELKKNFYRAKRKIFFRNLTLGYMTKTPKQLFFFPPTKSEYFFSNIENQNIFFWSRLF